MLSTTQWGILVLEQPERRLSEQTDGILHDKSVEIDDILAKRDAVCSFSIESVRTRLGEIKGADLFSPAP